MPQSDVYRALRSRIGLFESVVGRLQPILSQLPKQISTTVLTNTGREQIVGEIESALQKAATGLDLDAATDAGFELPPRPLPLYGFDDLDRVVTSESARPPGIHVSGMAQREYSYLAPGMNQAVRITTDSYQEHTESVELWSPGSPVFPVPDVVATMKPCLQAAQSENCWIRRLSTPESKAVCAILLSLRSRVPQLQLSIPGSAICPKTSVCGHV